MSVQVEWHGDEFQRALLPGLDDAVTAAAIELRGEMARNTMGIEGGGPVVRHVSNRTGHAYYSGPGAPAGRFPFIRTGALNRSMDSTKAKGLTAYAGSNMPYARRLEFGFFGTDSRGRTFHQPARPWARRSARQAAPAMLGAFKTVAMRSVQTATAKATGAP